MGGKKFEMKLKYFYLQDLKIMLKFYTLEFIMSTSLIRFDHNNYHGNRIFTIVIYWGENFIRLWREILGLQTPFRTDATENLFNNF